nr:hypothetical protein [Tanacetum cinerariifolium]
GALQRCHKEIAENVRLAREINVLCAHVTAIVDERVLLMDMLAPKFVLVTMAEFMKQIQSKDIPNMMKLQMVGREFELRAREKNIIVKKLKGNMDY